jgi:hypothetical protein
MPFLYSLDNQHYIPEWMRIDKTVLQYDKDRDNSAKVSRELYIEMREIRELEEKK